MSSLHEYRSVEEYLQRLGKTLSRLPAAKRDESLKEIGQHIETLISAERRVEDSGNEALQRSLEKFGNPEVIAKDLMRQYRRECWRRFGMVQYMLISRILMILLIISGTTLSPWSLPNYLLSWRVAWYDFLLAGAGCGLIIGALCELSRVSWILMDNKLQSSEGTSSRWNSHLNTRLEYGYFILFVLFLYFEISLLMKFNFGRVELINAYVVILVYCACASAMRTRRILKSRQIYGQPA